MCADKTIAFITCVNDEDWYAECLLYLRHLHLPAGFHSEYIGIRAASSMAAGYNEAMQKTAARYKVYLHQDTLLVYKDFPQAMLNIFADESIGVIGVIGCRSLPSSGVWWDGLRCYGRVLHACEAESIVDTHLKEPEGDYIEVEAADGLLLATQYDVTWREDLFTGWHFYDTSACREFARRSLRTVVAKQEAGFWCIHCPVEKPLSKSYKEYQKIFLKEYGKELRPEV